MGKFDDQISRMEYLMNFRSATNESRSAIEFSAEAADGKQYGIIREGSKYYIKVCKDLEKKNLAEAYDYIHGITSKSENEYKSYNEASKHFELKMMSLNEAYNGNKKTSTFDFKKDEKVFANLTEEARKELDRMHSILENSYTIGMNNTGNPEAPKTAKFAPSIGEPFEEKAEAVLDKDFNKTSTNHEDEGTPFEKEEKVTDADMQSDKAPKGGEAEKDMKDAEYVPEDAIAAKKVKGGKAVKMNESDDMLDSEESFEDDELVGFENSTDESESEELTDDAIANILSTNSFDDKDVIADEYSEEEDEIIPTDDEEEFEYEMPMESKKSLKRIVESVCDDVMEAVEAENNKNAVNEAFANYINNLVKEEMTKLNVFGKHPGYRKKPMTTPSNVEVGKSSDVRDWNDDSVKGEKPFGSKIGSSAPFDKQVKVLTDAVMKEVYESLKKK